MLVQLTNRLFIEITNQTIYSFSKLSLNNDISMKINKTDVKNKNKNTKFTKCIEKTNNKTKIKTF